MANESDIIITPLSGLNHIDALLDIGPDWNFMTPAGNTILYTFSIAVGNEPGQGPLQAFSTSQQSSARGALEYIGQVTGIQFLETSDGNSAHVHFAMQNLAGAGTTGLTSWTSSYAIDARNGALDGYDVDAWVYLDNLEWVSRNNNLSKGSEGYETLLHELGHVLGLKHPFEDSVRLPAAQDNTGNTLLSYNDSATYSTYRPYDIAALNWLYGGDGLRGTLGQNTSTNSRFITGTAQADILNGGSGNDLLQGDGGNDTINGGAGEDTAIVNGQFTSYSFITLSASSVRTVGQDGTDTYDGVEWFRFTDGVYKRAQLVDTAPPAPPILSTARNGSDFISGNQALLTGVAEPASAVKIYIGGALIGSATAGATGAYTVQTAALGDGSYLAFATATDAAGNVSGQSDGLPFKVDTMAPAKPTVSVNASGSSNEPLFSGSGEAGSVISLIDQGGAQFSVLGQTTVSGIL